MPWLCRDMDRWRVPVVAPFWDTFADRRDEARVQRGWPWNTADRAYRVWAERYAFFAALEQVPKVLSHENTNCRNLFSP